MHATTLGQLSQTLSTYVGPGQSFAPVLNQALEVIYGMGIWRDLTIEGTFDCSGGYFTLPDQADSVLFAAVNNQPARVHSLWHDYRAAGTNYDSTLSFGLVDDGFRPCLNDVLTVDSALANVGDIWVINAADTPGGDPTEFTFYGNSGDSITVVASFEPNNDLVSVTSTPGSSNFSFGDTINAVQSIQYTGLLKRYDLRLNSSTGPILATVGPGEGIARFRRYRVPQAETGAFVHVLCKRRFIPVQDDNDVVYISQISILKHAMLAILAEDNADLERSEIHWGKCRQYLDEQLDQYRGPARPSLDLQLYGEGIYATRNQY
jgi:hypothetical protein